MECWLSGVRAMRRVRAPVRESPHVSPPPLSRSTGVHLIPVGHITRPTFPSSHLFPWSRSGVGGGRRQNVKASRSRTNDKVKASRTNTNMSSLGPEGVAPESFDHPGEHGGHPGTSPAPVGGVILGVVLPASKAGDAPPPSTLAPAMSVRLYGVVLNVVPEPPEDVNTA